MNRFISNLVVYGLQTLWMAYFVWFWIYSLARLYFAHRMKAYLEGFKKVAPNEYEAVFSDLTTPYGNARFPRFYSRLAEVYNSSEMCRGMDLQKSKEAYLKLWNGYRTVVKIQLITTLAVVLGTAAIVLAAVLSGVTMA